MATNRNPLLARPLRHALVLCGALLLAFSATARDAGTPIVHGQGLLWKIEGRGAAPSYLFGTIHLADARATALPKTVEQAFDAATSFTMEAAVTDPAAIQLAAARMVLDDGRTLEDVVGADLFARTRAAVARHVGFDMDIRRHKPWALVALLSMPRPTGEPPLDLALQQRAATQGKPVHALETMAEQIAVFDDLTLGEQTELLAETLRTYPLMEGLIAEMLRLYLARDIGAVYHLDKQHRPANAVLDEKIERRLITDRNRRMAERMQPRLQSGRAFIAIGALHLPGEAGVLRLLERAGYRISRVY